jgi:hypothetical protein
MGVCTRERAVDARRPCCLRQQTRTSEEGGRLRTLSSCLARESAIRASEVLPARFSCAASSRNPAMVSLPLTAPLGATACVAGLAAGDGVGSSCAGSGVSVAPVVGTGVGAGAGGVAGFCRASLSWGPSDVVQLMVSVRSVSPFARVHCARPTPRACECGALALPLLCACVAVRAVSACECGALALPLLYACVAVRAVSACECGALALPLLCACVAVRAVSACGRGRRV